MTINYSTLFEQFKIWILEYKNFEQIINTVTLLTLHQLVMILLRRHRQLGRRQMIQIITELAPNFQTVICDDSFRNRHHETVMYQLDSCSVSYYHKLAHTMFEFCLVGWQCSSIQAPCSFGLVWLISHGWKYCWLVWCERKIMFVGW